ncbi:hypothetical protein VKT23_013492 [Stygiomarasmius scandens]|uniref:F-box domain-containing protein n=1 Tax=Marasmiellus scandens TaxID=2682957 RepID=A0ABR1J332_9AGAR
MLLSAELTDNIIDLINDSQTLKSCSLVSKAWRPRSQYRLFSTVLNLICPPVRKDLGSKSKFEPQQVSKYALDFFAIAGSAPTITNAVQRLKVPFDVVRQNDNDVIELTFPFKNLQTLEVVLIMERSCRENLANTLSRIELDLKGRVVQQTTAGTFSLPVIQQNIHSLHTLTLTNMIIDAELMQSVFEGLGAGRECSALSSLEFRQCRFSGMPLDYVSTKPYQAKFRRLSLSFDHVIDKEYFLKRFDVSGVHSLSCHLSSLLIKKFCKRLKCLTLYGVSNNIPNWQKRFNSLTELHFVHPPHTSAPQYYFCLNTIEAFSKFPTPLKVISLSHVFIVDPSFPRYARTFASKMDDALSSLVFSQKMLRKIMLYDVPRDIREITEKELLPKTMGTGLLKVKVLKAKEK